METSNYYLCDYCAKCKQLWVWANEVDCDAVHITAKRMFDHHGIDGKRYDEPTQVCEHYEPKGK